MIWETDWNVVTLGRIVGMLIVVAGIGLALWDALDVPYQVSGGFQPRLFFNSVLRWSASGFFIILAAEIADRLGSAGEEATEDVEEGAEETE